MFFVKGDSRVLCLLCYILLRNSAATVEIETENRPYEFSFNIVDFQHRYEKKDSEGIITGEYGFVTADGVYHETGYATDKNGDFIITRMRNRRITSLKDAQEIFKDRPEAAKKLVEAVAKACSACKIVVKQDNPATRAASTSTPKTIVNPLPGDTMRTLATRIAADEEARRKELSQGRNRIPENAKNLLNERRGKSLQEGIVRSMVDTAKKFLREKGTSASSLNNAETNDLYYRFNYTITSHEHQEEGYKSGKKDGSYRSQSENGVDTRVKYLSNEFGHQPNVSFVPRTSSAKENDRLKGYSFLWYWL